MTTPKTTPPDYAPDYAPDDAPDYALDMKRYLHLGATVIALLTIFFVGWASFARLDGAVLATGKIAVEGSRKTVQAAGSGVVSELLVRDGQWVEAGQTLVRIDHTVRDAQHAGARTRLDALLARRSRLEAEWSDADRLAFDAGLLDRATEASVRRLMAAEASTLHARREARRAEVAALEGRIPRLEATERGHRARANAARIEARGAAEALESARTLFEKGYLAKTRLLELERDHARAEGRHASSLADAESAVREVEEIRLAQQRDAKRWRERLAVELDDVRRELVEARRAFVESEQRLRHTSVTAPVSGRVFGLAIHTQGGVVRESDALLQIVPADAPLIVEARIPVHEVDRISQGQAARVRLSAFDDSDVAPVEGRVESISADRFEDPARGLGYYVARIRIEDPAKALLPDGFELRAGMPAETWIRTGERSALRYLMEPLTDSWSRAFLDG